MWDNVGTSCLVGHFVYVLPHSSRPKDLHTLDLKMHRWTTSKLSGQSPSFVVGASMALNRDRVLFFLRYYKRRNRRYSKVCLYALELVSKEWLHVPIYGESPYCLVSPLSAYWEARRMVLLHASTKSKARQTYTVDVETSEANLLRTTGPAPSPGSCYMSAFLPIQQEWVVSSRLESTDMLFVLNLNRKVPYWSQTSSYALGGRAISPYPIVHGSRLLYWGGLSLNSTHQHGRRIGLCSYELRKKEAEGLVFEDTQNQARRRPCMQPS